MLEHAIRFARMGGALDFSANLSKRSGSVTGMIQGGLELERGDRYVPAHGLPVDDGPSRAAHLPDEQLEQGPHVLHEQVDPVALGAVARRGEGISPVEEM